MEENMPALLDSIDLSRIQDLLMSGDLRSPMSEEMYFVLHGFHSKRRERDARNDFWRCLIYRPDVAHRVADLCGNPTKIGRPQAADLLKEIINWSVDFW